MGNLRHYAFYSYGKTQEFSDYFFLQLFFYAMEELGLGLDECFFYTDTGYSINAKKELMSNLQEIKCVVVPDYTHLNSVLDIYKDFYERKFFEEGIYVICLNEEEIYYDL